MFRLSRPQTQSILWVFVPTLVWSLFLQTLIVCIDPLLLPVLERKLPPRIAVLCRWLWVVSFSVTVLYAWNIGPGTYLFYIREALPFTPKFILWALLLATLILIWFASRRHLYQGLGRANSWIFVIGAVLFAIKAILVSDAVHSTFWRQHLGSPVMSNVRMTLDNIKRNKKGATIGTPESTFNSYVKHDNALPSRIVLMVVESWGETSDGLVKIADDISSQGFQIRKYGFTAYRGSTLSGEFRELCSEYVQPSGDLIDNVGQLNCAPKLLSSKQYDVIGIHGYRKLFYARGTFWERFGLTKQVFREEMNHLPECPGPFPAVCDENLISYGVDILDAAQKPLFLYMLTVSSHEPVEEPALDKHGKYFNEIDIVHPTQVITRRAISELVDRLKNRRGHECTLIYVAGDHQPPSASAKGGIFEMGKVPYLVFTDHCPAS
jgi:hypothetical protein